MSGDFAELNLFVYHRLCGALLDAVIWCLGPFADDSREYGLLRCYLALATRNLCRVCISPDDRG